MQSSMRSACLNQPTPPSELDGRQTHKSIFGGLKISGRNTDIPRHSTVYRESAKKARIPPSVHPHCKASLLWMSAGGSAWIFVYGACCYQRWFELSHSLLFCLICFRRWLVRPRFWLVTVLWILARMRWRFIFPPLEGCSVSHRQCSLSDPLKVQF